MKHSLKLFLICSVLWSCQSEPQKKLPKKSYNRFTGKLVKRPLRVESDWLGGTDANPIYFTAKGERIYTLDKDVYVYPETVQSVDHLGRVVYPSSGIQLVGDLKLKDYLLLVQAVSVELAGKKVNLRFEADSNFLERPARIFDLRTKKALMTFEYKYGKWRRLQ